MVRPSTRHTRPDFARVLKWDLPDGGAIKLEVHLVDVATWRADPYYADGNWHAIGDGSGYLLLARLTYRPYE